MQIILESATGKYNIPPSVSTEKKRAEYEQLPAPSFTRFV